MNNTPHVKAIIDTAALADNFRTVKKLAAGKRVFCVVKADAYGHSADLAVPAFLSAGADAFAVSSTAEALEIRALCGSCDILVIGWSDPCDAAALIESDIIQTAVDAGHLAQLDEAVDAVKMRGAVPDSARLRVHLKVDTGMNRLGFKPDDVDAALKFKGSPNIDICGAFTHLPCADMCDDESNERSRKAAADFINAVKPFGQSGFCRHFANSSSIMRHEELFCGIFDDCDAVRAGIILYGLTPSPEVDALTRSLGFKPVMSLYSVVSHLHTVRAGEAVSYGGTWTAARDSVLATVPAGYADGIPRLLSGGGHAYVGGREFPIAGRVCMDQLMLDVTGAKVNQGDDVCFFGAEHPCAIAEIAAAAQTINYEITCCINKRVARVKK